MLSTIIGELLIAWEIAGVGRGRSGIEVWNDGLEVRLDGLFYLSEVMALQHVLGVALEPNSP